MADNVTDGTYTFATDDISDVHYPIEKLAFGALNTATIVSHTNPFPVTSGAAAAFDHGSNRDVDTTAEQINSSSVVALHGVWLAAHPDNPGIVYIGNSDVTAGTTDATDGWPLHPGREAFFRVNNVNLLYGRGDAANNIVFWRTE